MSCLRPVNGGSVEFEQYSMVEDLVDALADVQRCFTVLEPAEEVEPKGFDCQSCSQGVAIVDVEGEWVCRACILVMQDEPQDVVDLASNGQIIPLLLTLRISMWISAFASALVLLLSPVPTVRFMESDDDLCLAWIYPRSVIKEAGHREHPSARDSYARGGVC